MVYHKLAYSYIRTYVWGGNYSSDISDITIMLQLGWGHQTQYKSENAKGGYITLQIQKSLLYSKKNPQRNNLISAQGGCSCVKTHFTSVIYYYYFKKDNNCYGLHNKNMSVISLSTTPKLLEAFIHVHKNHTKSKLYPVQI